MNNMAITMEKIYEELKKIELKIVTREEIISLIETGEIEKNSETMTQIEDSTKNISKGKTKMINSANDLLSEM